MGRQLVVDDLDQRRAVAEHDPADPGADGGDGPAEGLPTAEPGST